MESTIRLSAEIRVTEHQDGALLLDIRGGKFFSVDPVGSLIVRWLQQGADAKQLLEHLRTTFPEETGERLNRDLEEFLNHLTRMHLVSTGQRHGN